MNLDWMRPLADPEARLAFVREPSVALDFPAEWSVATDGKGLLAVAGAGDGLRRADGEECGRLRPHLAPLAGDPPPDAPALDLVALREWCRGGRRDEQSCDTCGGKGFHECPTCEDEHDCGRCDGKGMVRSGASPGLVADVLIDRTLLAKFLPPEMPGGEARAEAADGGKALRLWGDGWRLVLMAMTVQPGQSCPAPAFGAEAVAAP